MREATRRYRETDPPQMREQTVRSPMRQTLVDLAMDAPTHPTMVDPKTGLPLRALGVTSRGPIWPVMGASHPPVPEPPTPPVPTPPVAPPGFVSAETHQAELTRIAAAEKAQGERKGLRAAIEALGLDPETTKLEDVRAILAKAEADRQASETEAERVVRAAAAAQAASDQATAAAAADRLATRIERQLIRSGITLKDDATQEEQDAYDARLADARKLIDAKTDASDDDIKTAVAGLKTRIPGLFTVAAAPPPPPGGAPTGTPPRREPAGDAYERGAARNRGGEDKQRQPAATSTMFG